nr:MAG TPA: Major capsid protein [Microviridae sp.]
MAHFTGLKELQNHPHKAGFDIGSKNVFTAKVGELLPVYWDMAIPGCDYDIDLAYFTRTRPVQTAAYTRVREFFDFYAVPCDLLWKSFDSAVIQLGEIAPVQSKTLLDPLTVGTDIPWCYLSDIADALYYSNGNKELGKTVSVHLGFGNIFNFNRGDVNAKLISYLNYGNFVRSSSSGVGTSSNRWWNTSFVPTDVPNYSQKYFSNNAVSLFPLLAYQKIYQDFFRWSQWENADPTSYNVDYYAGEGNLFGPSGIASSIPSSNAYWKRDNMFSLRYCNWNKDMFMGILPSSQFGDISVVSGLDGIETFVPVEAFNSISELNITNPPLTGTHTPVFTDSVMSSNTTPSQIRVSSKTGTPVSSAGSALGVRSLLGGEFSILALRQAEALQKWKEITQSVDTNYRDQIKAHFGISTPASMSHMAQYIGGIARNLDISEVVNNNLSDSGSEAIIYGKGVGTGTGKMRYHTGSQYCIIMCIYHAMPLLDYAISGQDPQLLCTSVEDLPIPEFDNIGMEAVPSVALFNSSILENDPSAVDFLGYNPRYWAWKSKIDRVHGAFTTTLKDWVAPIDDLYLNRWFSSTAGTKASVSWPFFKVNPNTLDSIFAVQADSIWDTDQLLVNCDVSCKVVRPLSQDGMPY